MLTQIWDRFFYLENEQTSRTYLLTRYQQLGFDEAEKLSYQATSKFLYSIKQAREYFVLSTQASLICRPLLLYYGMVALARTVIVAGDPSYPSSTSVLKHGLSTKKRKREQYDFIEDDVRIQKDGLFIDFHHHLGGTPLESGTRLVMKDIFSSLPDLHDAYLRTYGTSRLMSIIPASPITIPRTFLSNNQMTKDEFQGWLTQNVSRDTATFQLLDQESDHLLVNYDGDFMNTPIISRDITGKPYLHLQYRDLHIPEPSYYFVAAFLLGMMGRYEPERWGELVLSFSSKDLYIIHEFLQKATIRFPAKILQLLLPEE